MNRTGSHGLLLKAAATLAAAACLFTGVPVYAAQPASNTTTPIQHVVVIFQENVSFDHYFATYPNAANPASEPQFKAKKDTPTVNGLAAALLSHNPNSTAPFRFDRSQAATCDQNHEYSAEQEAFDNSVADKFVETVGTGPSTDGFLICKATDVMGYYDGNTVTAQWNYAQHFAMSDNSFGTTYGPSTPGALNLVSGQTHGANVDALSTPFGADAVSGSVVGDPQPQYDDCTTRENLGMTGQNIGDLLNAQGISWGWFQGGFRPSAVVAGKAQCKTSHIGSDGKPKGDYIPHHEPFQYYVSTSNPHHLPPTSVDMVGKQDQANHQYDLIDYYAALAAGNLPAVTFLKAPGYQDGHAGYSDPLAEQTFIVNTINQLENSPFWSSTAIIIAYDDSDGWYDHVVPPVVQTSQTAEDHLNAPGSCGTAKAGEYQGRCGYGPRLPLLVISPFAKRNFVDGGISDQSSILKFIEDNWSTGRIGDQSFDDRAGTLNNMFDFKHGGNDPLFLDPSTGLEIGN
jgi:phospholipase C